jgi:hypothetical protein
VQAAEVELLGKFRRQTARRLADAAAGARAVEGGADATADILAREAIFGPPVPSRPRRGCPTRPVIYTRSAVW